MLEKINKLKEHSSNLDRTYSPLFFRIYRKEEYIEFESLLNNNRISFVHDEIYDQLKDLIKCKNPSKRLADEDYTQLIKDHIGSYSLQDYGVWVYYPWNQKMVHILDEEEYKQVRTNRNQYKITKQEQDILAQKKIGIIGLSVGQSIALTLAMERGFGEIRLADFDVLELSNMNRIRTSISNLNIPKVTIAAREMLEIDPFLNISCFFDGLTDNNIDDFFLKNGKLDLLVDECDGLDMKIIARHKARDLKIPVIMDTSDRGMLDVERFDLEPNRPLLHGKADGVNPHTIKELSNEDKVPIILQLLGAENISSRGKASMVEVQQTINTWPQLASSVTLGGAVAADVSRRILLNQYTSSGRYYIDIEELVSDTSINNPSKYTYNNPHLPISLDEMKQILAEYPFKTNKSFYLDKTVVSDLVKAAIAAPSTGNDQPWKWLYKENSLFLFHEESRSHSFGDFQKTASYISLGAAFENLYIEALNQGINASIKFHPLPNQAKLVAVINFSQIENTRNIESIKTLGKEIQRRHTNRNFSEKKIISNDILEALANTTTTIEGANIQYYTNDKDLRLFAKMIGACDRIRLLNPAGHHDFVNREMRWTGESAESTKDGIDVKTLGLNNSQLAALSMLKDSKVISYLKDWQGGKAFDTLANRTISGASALCLITIPQYSLESFFRGGMAIERFWLKATQLNLAVHPLISPLYLFTRLIHGKGEGIDENNINELHTLRREFQSITGLTDNHAEVFLAKIAIAPEPELKSYRLPINNVLFFD
ncbi:Rv1355c family protein [Pseudopedobacter beijingensis]|uniref:Rv1355c family protein n=1 Tax=Pseudopedobacter beijingensis TaxID=1207056 RepID=A0ABW4IC06_9SPHI